MPSAEFEELEQRLTRGDWAAATGIIELAHSGDADAQFKTAEFRLRGIGGVLDLEDSRAQMQSAAAKGHAEARRSLAYFTAAGIGTPPDPQRAREMLEELAKDDDSVAAQLRFLDRMTCEERVKTAERRLYSPSPRIEVVCGLFSPQECRYIQDVAAPLLEPAMVYSASGQPMRDPDRDSDNMVITPMAEDLVVQTINRCIAKASGTEYNWGEPLHVLRYGPGQQYRPHYDALGFVPVAQRRLATALLYLNDDYEGGETHFPELGITVRGAMGDLLVFHNLTVAMEPDSRMIHAGLPITRGEKWLASRWIRCGDFFGRAN